MPTMHNPRSVDPYMTPRPVVQRQAYAVVILVACVLMGINFGVALVTMIWQQPRTALLAFVAGVSCGLLALAVRLLDVMRQERP